jgi:peptide/nickel transport system ATP-binding protein/oligopeptide transport system ATP-binding protein
MSLIEAPGAAPAHHTEQSEPLLEVHGLSVDFQSERGSIHAVRDVDLTLHPGEVLGVLGESGSGKSVTSRAIMGLVASPPGVVTGSIVFEGKELAGADDRHLESVRGKRMAMVFQDSLDSLNPAYTVGSQLTEIFRVRAGRSSKQARAEAVRLMEAVGIPNGADRMHDYPHQFSGGMRQRICIAMAIALEPRLLIADEPTTALDVTVQLGILRLLAGLQRSAGMAMIFVTHDVSVARLIADRVVVMYAGQVVEEGPVDDLVTAPAHPYTRALLHSQPGYVDDWHLLRPIGGSPPERVKDTHGCPFAPRCGVAQPECFTQDPPMLTVAAQHSRCFFAEDVHHGTR